MGIERTAVSLPIGLKDRAHELGINISAVSARAIRHQVEILEKAGVQAAKPRTPTTTPKDGDQGVAGSG